MVRECFTAASRVPLAALITAILLLSTPEHTSGETEESCPYQYTVVPQPEYNCNPIGQATRLPLSCSVVQTALGPPTPHVQLRWYWTTVEEDAGISGIWIIETTYGEFEYFLREEIHTTPISQMLLSTITFDFTVNNTGYYWCQVALDQNTLLSPSTVIFIEQRNGLFDCKNNDLSVSLTESDHICAQPLSLNTSEVTPTTMTLNDSAESKNSKGLLVWQSLVGAVLGIAIIVVLMFSLVSVYSVRRARKKRSAQARPADGIPNAISQTDLSRTSSRYLIAPIRVEQEERVNQQPPAETNSTNSVAETSQPRITSASIAMYTVPNGVSPLHLEMSTFLQNRNVNQNGHYEPLRRETVDYLNVYSSCVQKNLPALSESESVYSDNAEKQSEMQEVDLNHEPYPVI